MKAYSLIVKGYGRDDNEVMLERTLQDIGRDMKSNKLIEPDAVFLNSVMDAYIRCGKSKKCISLFEYATSDLTARRRIDHSIPAYWDCFKDKQIQPIASTFNTLLKALRDSTDKSPVPLEGFLAVVQRMKVFDVRPNSITVNTLIDAIVSTGNNSDAKAVLFNNPEFPLPPDSIEAGAGVEGYTSLIAGLAKEGDMHSAFDVLDLMISRGVRPNVQTLAALMNACMMAGKTGLQRAKALINKGDSKYLADLTPEEHSALRGSHSSSSSSSSFSSSLLTCVCHTGAYIIGLCRIARNDFGEGRVAALQEAQLALVEMARRNIVPDTATVNAFLQALCALRRPKVAESILLLTAMVDLKLVVPDDFTYTILFSALGKGNLGRVRFFIDHNGIAIAVGFAEEALNMFHSISNDKPVSIAVTNSFLSVFVNSSQPLKAVEYFDVITSGNVSSSRSSSPTTVTFTILFTSLIKFLANAMSKSDPSPSTAANGAEMRSKTWTSSNATSMAAIVQQFVKRIEAPSFGDAMTPIGKLLNAGDPADYASTNHRMAILLKIYALINVSAESSVVEVPHPSYLSLPPPHVAMADVDKLLRSLFYRMRYEYGVHPDQRMVGVLNSLFALQSVAVRNQNLFYSRNADNELAAESGSLRIFSRETAKFVLEEVIIAGTFEPFHPSHETVHRLSFLVMMHHRRLLSSPGARHIGMLRLLRERNRTIFERRIICSSAAARFCRFLSNIQKA